MKAKASKGKISVIKSDFTRNKWTYMMAIPGFVWYIIFAYAPIYGLVIAFKNYNVIDGIMGSPWAGFRHFETFFRSEYFFRLVKNTILLNFYGIVFGFPIPIILALMMNNLKNKMLKVSIQTTTYLPHFISVVVVCGMVIDFTANRGFVTEYVNRIFNTEYKNLLDEPQLYRMIYIISDIWQGAGWGSIIYLAALAGVDEQLYDAAKVDGARKFGQLIHVTIPGIMPTIIIMLILRIGSVMSLGADKTLLLYNPITYERSDIISSYVFRRGIEGGDMSFSAAVGMFNSVINCILVVTANSISKKFTEQGLF